MATIRAYSDLEQSKKLAEILPLESADMRYGYIAPYDYSDRMYDGGYDEIPYPKDFLIKNPNFSANEYDAELPCWSLAALLSILPQSVRLVGTPKDSYWYCECDNGNNQWRADFKSADNPVDACVEMIIKLNELKML